MASLNANFVDCLMQSPIQVCLLMNSRISLQLQWSVQWNNQLIANNIEPKNQDQPISGGLFNQYQYIDYQYQRYCDPFIQELACITFAGSIEIVGFVLINGSHSLLFIQLSIDTTMFVDPVAVVVDQTFPLDGANKTSRDGNRDNQWTR